MLVLGRKVGERIVVPECNMTISVLSVRGNRVQIGISAPMNISIMREELVSVDATTDIANSHVDHHASLQLV